MDRSYKRKNYLIEKSFQLNFILRFCIIVILSSLVFGAILFWIFGSYTTVAIENTKVVVKRTSDFMMPLMTLSFLIVSFCSALAVFFMTMYSSHKIAGPLFRLKREIDNLKEGDLRRNFTIRTQDQLQDFAKSLSFMCIALREKHSELKDKCSQLAKLIKHDSLPGSQESKEQVAKLLEEIDKALSYFKV